VRTTLHTNLTKPQSTTGRIDESLHLDLASKVAN
jgi:hypothetical protein